LDNFIAVECHRLSEKSLKKKSAGLAIG